MTGRERILTALSRQPHDRPPFLLWGLDPITGGWMTDFPSYKPLLDLIESRVEFKVKWVVHKGTFISDGVPTEVTVSTDIEGRKITRTTVETPRGPIFQEVKDVAGTMAGATVKYFVESDEDLERWLSIPYKPMCPSVEKYFELDRAAGDRGIVTARFPDPVGQVSELFHPQDFLLWTATEPDRMKHLLDLVFKRIYDLVGFVLNEDARPVFIFEGPEVATPPLLSPAHFDWMVVPYLQKLIGLVHDSGCPVIVHCHGNLDAVLERFVEVGADAVHPVESPPWGDTPVADFVDRVGKQLSMVGNIQIDSMLHSKPEDVVDEVRCLMAEANRFHGLLISTTATPYEIPLSELTIANYRALIDAALG